MRSAWKMYQTPQQAWKRVTRYSAAYQRYIPRQFEWIAVGLVMMIVVMVGVGLATGAATTSAMEHYTQTVDAWLPH